MLMSCFKFIEPPLSAWVDSQLKVDLNMRRLATFAVSFSAAVFMAQYVLPVKFQLALCFVFLIADIVLLLVRAESRMRATIIAFGLTAGLLWNSAYHTLFFTPAQELDGTNQAIKAEVNDYPQKTAYGYSVTVKLLRENGTVKSLLYTDETGAGLKPGDIIETYATLKLADRIADEESTYYTSKGILLIASQKTELKMQSSDRIPLRYIPAAFAKQLKDTAAEVFPEDIVPFMTAIITGDKSKLSDGAKTSLSVSGLAHTVAVSGLHVSTLVGFITLMARRRRLAAAVGIPTVLFFVAVVGASPSVVRAGFMQILILTAPLFKRETDTPTSLSAALMMLLIQNPFAAASVSLQLSFASTAGIVLFGTHIYDWMCKRFTNNKSKISRPARTIYSSLSTTFGVLIFTTPLMVIHFQTINIIAPISNLIALWAATSVFVLGIIACLAGLIYLPAGALIGWVTWPLAKYFLTAASLLSRIPFASLYVQSPLIKLWLVLIYTFIGIFILSRRNKSREGMTGFFGQKPRLFIPICSAAAALTVVLWIIFLTPQKDNMVFTVLDVGQGQSLVVMSEGRTAVIDCGGNKKNAGDIAAEYLMSQNRFSVDVLILTHYHSDHANGVLQLMSRLNVGYLALPDVEDEADTRDAIVRAARESGTEIVWVTGQTEITMGKVTLTLIEPVADIGVNERCVSVLCTYEQYDVLVTGDMDIQTENKLTAAKQLPDTEVFIAGHHGSKYASGKTLLDAIAPEVIIISVGNNSYGHPTEEMLNRAGDAGAVIYRTDIMGHITVRR